MRIARHSSLAAILMMLVAACQSDRTSGPMPKTLPATGPFDVTVTAVCDYCVFGPTTYTRNGGGPVTETATFAADPGPGVLDLDNLGTDVKASVTLNGVALASGKVDAGSGHETIDVTLLASNVLEIQLKGKPGGQVEVKIRPDCLPNLPAPQIVFDFVETRDVRGVSFDFYQLNVPNRASFPNFLFAHSPGLPPCGSNTNESRSWVDLFANLDGGTTFTRTNGFCALPNSDALDTVLLAIPSVKHPTKAFMTINDRKCAIIYTSNTTNLF